MVSGKRLVALTLMAFVAFFVFTGLAQAAALKLSNKSASDIHAIYISDSGTNDWEENIIEGYILPSGNEVDIQITGSYKFFDLRVEDGDGNSEEYDKFPGKTRQITLRGGGDSEYR